MAGQHIRTSYRLPSSKLLSNTQCSAPLPVNEVSNLALTARQFVQCSDEASRNISAPTQGTHHCGEGGPRNISFSTFAVANRSNTHSAISKDDTVDGGMTRML